MWKFHDSQMKKLQKIYQRTSKQTQNRIQELIDTFNFSFDTLYNMADNKNKERINAYIEEWQDKGLLEGQFGLLARNIYQRTRVKNSEILELLIYGAYVEEQSKLKETELNIMQEDAGYYYNEGLNEVRVAQGKKKKHSFIPSAIFLSLLAIPNSKGYIWQEYIDAITKYNADQIYRQATIDLQQQKNLDITNDIYQNIIKQQNKSRLNINGDKISGDIDNQMIGINNMAKVEGMKKETPEYGQVRFLAVTDEHSTDVCQSLKDQLFYINKENEFYRMYGATPNEARKVRIKCNGLVLGLNLPPIRNYFHWCRSSITYNDKDSNYYSAKYLKRNTLPFKNIVDKLINASKNKTGTIETLQEDVINGKKYIVDGKNVLQDHSRREIEVANILKDKYGFDVKIRPRVVNPQGVEVSDYYIDGEEWDLKDFEKNIDNRIKGSKEQANNFILDLRKTKISEGETINQLNQLYKSDSRYWVKKIMIIKNDEIISYLTRN